MLYQDGKYIETTTYLGRYVLGKAQTIATSSPTYSTAPPQGTCSLPWNIKLSSAYRTYV